MAIDKSVLIFDADPVSREHLAGGFRDKDYRIASCAKYDKAIEYAGAGKYGFVVVHMHDTEEMQLAMRLRGMQPDAHFLVQGDSDTLAVNIDALIAMDTIPLTYKGPTSAQ